MAKSTQDLLEFAEKYYPEDSGKVVSVGLVRAWLFEHHYHVRDTGIPVVESLDLEKFVRENSEVA